MDNSESEIPLFLTFSFEGKGSRGMLAKMLVSSLMRGLFSGSQMVFRNIETPLFRIERREVDEMMVTLAVLENTEKAMREANRTFLFSLTQYVSPAARQWVIIADAAGLALRNIDHLIPPDSPGTHEPPEVDLYWTKVADERKETGMTSASPGLWAVRGEHLPMVLKRWEKAWSKQRGDESLNDGEVWSQVLQELPLRKMPFEKGEVAAPRVNAVNWEALSNAAFVTVPDWPAVEQRKFLQALYFGTYFGDETRYKDDVALPEGFPLVRSDMLPKWNDTCHPPHEHSRLLN